MSESVRAGGWGLRRPPWAPPAELVVGPALVVLLLHAVTTREALFPNQGDLLLYFQKAEAVAQGAFPYRDVAFEYPPLALVSMLVPYVAWPWGPPDFPAYRWLFTAWQILLLVATVLVTARLADRLVTPDVRTAGTRLLLLAIVTAPSLTFRFDLLPALLVALAVLAVLEGHAGRAGVLVAAGGLAKVYPFVLVPILAAVWLAPLDRSRLATFGSAIGIVVAGVLLPVSLVAGDAAWGFLAYQAERGLQLETVAAGFIMLGAALRGGIVPLEFEFGAVHVAGSAADAYLAVQPWLFVLAPLVLAGLALLALRLETASGRAVRPATVLGLALAALVLFILTNKVISVQYVVWLLPLAALLGRGQFWLTVAIGIGSVAIHPLFYDELIDQQLFAVALLCLRNILLIALLGWLLLDLVRGPDAEAAASD